MKTLVEIIVQDLIDDKAFFGPDGDIWYTSGPASDVSKTYVGMALVERIKTAESAAQRIENDNAAITQDPPNAETGRRQIERRFEILFRAARECCMCECDICGKKCPWHAQIIKIVPATEEGFLAWIDAEIAAQDEKSNMGDL